jgi:ADP-ribose pyrophosphatase YjhB (NUDIX family)
MSIYCFNCKNKNHGFKQCKFKLNVCTNCNTLGHHDKDCIYFNTLCYRCIEDGHLIKETECDKHRNLKRCGAIIVDHNLNLLIVQNHSGIWSIPKGHQTHRKEPYTVCASREVYEETGLKLKIDKNCKKVTIGNIVYFLITLNDNYKNNLQIRDKSEIKKITWIHIKDLGKLENMNWSLKKLVKLFNNWKKTRHQM